MIITAILAGNVLGQASGYATRKITHASSSFLADPELKKYKVTGAEDVKLNPAKTGNKLEKTGKHKFTIR